MIRSSKIVIFEIRFPNCKLRTTKPEALRTSGSLFAALSLVRRRLAERLFHLQCLSDIHQPCRKGLVLLSFHDALRAVLRQCSSSSVFEELFLPESRRPFSFGTFLSQSSSSPSPTSFVKASLFTICTEKYVLPSSPSPSCLSSRRYCFFTNVFKKNDVIAGSIRENF